METLLCAAVGTVSHQPVLATCTVCMWRPYCVQLQAQKVISMGQKNVLCIETLLCVTVGTASHQLVLACTVYGDTTVCSCGHSKSSAWVRRMCCAWRPYCAAVGTASRQPVLAAFTVYGDPAVCSCRHTESLAIARSIYCVWRHCCVQLQAHKIVRMCQQHALCVETLLCAAVGTGNQQPALQACVVYGDPNVCSCTHSNSSSWARSLYWVCKPYCVQLQAQQVIIMSQKHVLCMETVLCGAVGTVSHYNVLEVFTAY